VAEPDADPEPLDTGDVVPAGLAWAEPGSANTTAPPAAMLATPTPAVIRRSRRLASSRAATADRTSLGRALVPRSGAVIG
jgi:hypothetical protein